MLSLRLTITIFFLVIITQQYSAITTCIKSTPWYGSKSIGRRDQALLTYMLYPDKHEYPTGSGLSMDWAACYNVLSYGSTGLPSRI